MENARLILEQIFYSAVAAANPYQAVLRHCADIRFLYNKGNFQRLLVIGFGKASPSMAKAVEESLGDILETGVIVTKYGHGDPGKEGKIRVFEAGHPIPDENGQRAAERIADLVGRADEWTLVVTLISGGGSALFVSPHPLISLAEKQKTTDLLLKAGADIHELNTVRKHLSRVKGGRFAEIIHPATGISLILSDVIGDRLDVIASGPTAPDPTTYRDALDVLATYRLLNTVPESVVELLLGGENGRLPETPKPGNPLFHKVTNRIIGSNGTALEAARKKAEGLGLRTEILADTLSGEARETGKWLAHKAVAVKRTAGSGTPLCLISGGETTVTVTGGGKGGRNMELALSFAAEIEGISGITLLSAGTDGTDGPTDAAGAVVDGRTAGRGRTMGLNPEAYIRNNDSYSFFERTGELFITGPTGTNVMDMQLILVGADGDQRQDG
ncbi:MAG TPA: glycerate kinase [Geobacteraceae bacterium]|nr:glycerate kinase [Geobacteraceae bacterium]